MKGFLLGILLIIVVGVGGFVYRNAVEHPNRPIACPLDTLVCPDGTPVARTGESCTFSACLPPNVSLADAGIAFAIPAGMSAAEIPDMASVAAYEHLTEASTSARIIIRRYLIDASTTPLTVIQQTAINGTSGLPVGMTSFSSAVIGGRRFTVVSIERFESVVDTAYYLAHGSDILRFDAIDGGVAGWADARLDTASLPAHAAISKLLSTLQVL